MSEFQGFNQPNHELLLSIFAVTHFFILDANRVRDSVNASFSIIMATLMRSNQSQSISLALSLSDQRSPKEVYLGKLENHLLRNLILPN